MAVILCYFSEFAYLPAVLHKSSCSLSHLLMSFCSNRVGNTWNSLPNWVSANTTNTFKARLNKFWHNQEEYSCKETEVVASVYMKNLGK